MLNVNYSNYFISLVTVIRLFALLLLAGSTSWAQADQGKPFLWQVNDGSHKAYLLGSIHVFKRELYPLAPVIERSFKASEVLVVEADISSIDAAQYQQRTMELGVFDHGQTLSRVLAPQTRKLLSKYSQSRGVPEGAFDNLKPWLVNLTVITLEAQALGYAFDQGIDLHFMRAAKASGKKIVELEGMEHHLQILAGDPLDVQELTLRVTLQDLDEMDEALKRMMQYWRKGEVQALTDYMLEPMQTYPKLEPYLEKLLNQRNREMAARIKTLMAEGKTLFVVVGALHMGGAQGIPALLRAQGLDVEQMEFH